MSCYCVMHITRGGMVLPLSKCCLPRLIKAHQAKITAILLIGNIKGHSAISIPAHIPLLTKRYAFNVSEKAGHATPPIQIYPKPIQLQKQSPSNQRYLILCLSYSVSSGGVQNIP